MGKINFFTESIKFSVPNPKKTKSWLLTNVAFEKAAVKEINFIFCSDDYLLSINKEYLNHHTLTDIVTFDNSEIKGSLEADIFISVERVKDNAGKFETDIAVELRRVMIHGVLHLLGYRDKTIREKSQMRKKEDHYLSLWA